MSVFAKVKDPKAEGPIAIIGESGVCVFLKDYNGKVYVINDNGLVSQATTVCWNDLMKDKSRRTVYAGDELTLTFK